MPDSCIPIPPRLRVVCRVLQKFFNFVDNKPFWLSHLFSFRWNLVPKVTIAQSPRDTVAQSPRDTVVPMSQRYKSPITQRHNSPISQRHNSQISQRHKRRDSKIQTLVLLGQSSQFPPTRRLRPCLLLLVRVGRPNVTAACPYPALRLDKLYAALIRCLILWTITLKILVFLFKGLYLVAGGSDVTRGFSCDPSWHLFGSDVIRNTLPSLYLHALRLSNYVSSYIVALTLAKRCEDWEVD